MFAKFSKTLILLLYLCYGSFLLVSCDSVKAKNQIDLKSFENLISNSDISIVLFYTDWCAGKNRIEDIYPQYLAKAKEKHTQIIIIAADNNISDSVIKAHAKQGFLSYRIDAGSLAILNRRNIKKYVNAAFPNHHIMELAEFGYPLPLELWVTKDFKVLNEKDLLDNIQLADWLLDTKTIEVKRE